MGSWIKNNIPIWFFILVAIYLLVRLSRPYIELPFILKNYFTDLICLPVVLMFCLIGVRILKRQKDLQLNIWHVTIVLFQFIVIFEIILPKYATTYTRDWIDALLYAIGAIVFYFFLQPKSKKIPSN